jgi:hypothetical protein
MVELRCGMNTPFPREILSTVGTYRYQVGTGRTRTYRYRYTSLHDCIFWPYALLIPHARARAQRATQGGTHLLQQNHVWGWNRGEYSPLAGKTHGHPVKTEWLITTCYNELFKNRWFIHSLMGQMISWFLFRSLPYNNKSAVEQGD